MAIAINGSGTMTGISVGGLPDGIVDAGTLATNSVDSDELINGAIDSGHLASGVGGATVKVVSATYDSTTASGTQDITGFGFDPLAVWGMVFYNTVDDWGMGFTDFTTHRMVVSYATTTGAVAGQAQFPYIMHSGGNTQSGVASSITDGFRITWTKSGSPTGTLHMYFIGVK